MLKKIGRLFLKGESSDHVATKTKDIEQTADHPAELRPTAEELKKIGNQHFDSGDIARAESYYKQALDLDPTSSSVYANLGVVSNAQGKFEEAISYYDQAIMLKPDFAEIYSNRGLILNGLNRLDEALDSVDRAIELKPDFVFAHNNRGLVLMSQCRYEEALISYDRAIALKPDYAEAHNNRGSVFDILNKLEAALASFDCAIKFKSNYAEAFFNRGHVLVKLNKVNEAFFSYSNALSLMPNHALIYGHWAFIKRVLCDWENEKHDLNNLVMKINNGENALTPLFILALLDSPIQQKRVAEIFAYRKFPKSNIFPLLTKLAKHKKIRLGYFSADFRNHPVSFLTAELYEKHNKTKFELIAFSFSTVEDGMTKRIASAFDRFIDVSKQSDQAVALMARALEIDIAIDLSGFTGGCRTGVFALRAAPIQVNYLGFPGTMGADYIDYIIADATIIPATHQQYYTEKVAYLPSFQANDTKRLISDRKFSRAELGLPATGFVFCSFNNIPKINPIIFDSWMRILKQVEGSVLWMLGENATAVNNLRKEATARGVNCNRIIFAKRESLPDYLARYRMADLFLDTLPFNAGTTASDALWAGLPVITQIGESFAGRMAASLLNAIQLPELITTTQKGYEALAVELAKNPDKLTKIKQKLADNRLSTPLFDIDYFTKHIEAAYAQMYERSQSGLPPDHVGTLHKII